MAAPMSKQNDSIVSSPETFPVKTKQVTTLFWQKQILTTLSWQYPAYIHLPI